MAGNLAEVSRANRISLNLNTLTVRHVVLFTIKKFKILPIHYVVPSTVRRIPILEMLKCVS